MEERKFSVPSNLIDLEEVINTRTPVWDIAGSGDVRIKLDTDVNDHEWYVLSDDRNVEPLYGKVECWAFPHFNGAHDQYSYEPIKFCFNTFAELLSAHPTERAIWGYDLEEYATRTRLAHEGMKEQGFMDLFGEIGPLEGIDLIAREAWENSDPEEIGRREWNRLVNRIKEFADKLDYDDYWEEDKFFFKVPPSNGGPCFELTFTGLHEAIAWLEKA